jgi:hypothetical protein
VVCPQKQELEFRFDILEENSNGIPLPVTKLSAKQSSASAVVPTKRPITQQPPAKNSEFISAREKLVNLGLSRL